MSNSKEKKTSEYRNLILPFRVVVFDVLPFHQLHVCSDSIREFELYGVFKRDRYRRIFFLFSNINISRSVPIYLDLRQIKILSFTEKLVENDFRKQILRHTKLMIKCEKIKFCFPYHGLNFRVFHPNTFQKLRSIEIEYSGHCSWNSGPLSKELSELMECEKILRNLENFNIRSFEGKSPNLSYQGRFSNLKTLTLGANELPHNTILDLPKVVRLELGDCKGLINVRNCKNLKSLIYHGTSHQKFLRNMLLNCGNDSCQSLERLSLYYFGRISNDLDPGREISYLFKCDKFLKLKHLRLEGATYPSKVEKFSEKLVSLHLIDVRLPVHYLASSDRSNFNENFLYQNYPNLRCLKIRGFKGFYGRRKLLYAVNIKKLYLSQLLNLDYSYFLNNNDFGNLEFLSMKYFDSAFGKPLKQDGEGIYSRKIKVLGVSGFRVEESFFSQKFPKLEYLHCCNCKTLTFFKMWKFEVKKLRRIDMKFLPKFDLDAFFGENEFPLLEKLVLQGPFYSPSGTKIGRRWKEMKNLIEIRFSKMNIADEFFQRQNLENVREIFMVRCPLIKVNGWKKLQSLVRIEYFRCKNVEPDICEKLKFLEKDYPFPRGAIIKILD